MIYVDASVALATLLMEDRQPPHELWSGSRVVSSALLGYEVWNTVHRHAKARPARVSVDEVLGRIEVFALVPDALRRAIDPFPLPLRTLDALHLATADFVRAQGEDVQIASYDRRFNAVARAMGFELVEL